MLTFINLFLVPFLCLSIYSRRHRETVTLSGTWLVRYAVFTVCNVLLTHGALYAVKLILHRQIAAESAKYTVIAMVTAFLLPYLCDLFNAVFARIGFQVGPR